MRRPDSPGAETITSSPSDAPGEGEWLAPGRIRTVLQLSRALSAADDREGAAATATELIALASGARSAEVAERLGAGGLALVARSAAGERAERGDGVPRRGTRAEREVLRTRAPVWAPSGCGEHDRGSELQPGDPRRACAYLPLIFGGGVDGILTLTFDAERAFDRGTREFLLELAVECSSALARGRVLELHRDRAAEAEAGRADAEAKLRWSERLVRSRTHLFERERFSRARAEADAALAARYAEDAQRLTWALAHAETSSAVLDALARHGPAAFGATGLILLVLAPDGAMHVLASAPEGEAGLPRAGARIPVADGSAEAEVLLAGAPAWRGAADRGPYPASVAETSSRRRGDWLGVPVEDTGVGAGVFALTFGRERAVGPDECVRLVVLAEGCASVFAERAGCESEARRTRAAIDPE